MAFSRPIELKDTLLAAGKEPLVCTPLVGADEDAVFRELAAIVPKKPDFLEWRVDFFVGIADVARVVALCQAIQEKSGGVPLGCGRSARLRTQRRGTLFRASCWPGQGNRCSADCVFPQFSGNAERRGAGRQVRRDGKSRRRCGQDCRDAAGTARCAHVARRNADGAECGFRTGHQHVNGWLRLTEPPVWLGVWFVGKFCGGRGAFGAGAGAHRAVERGGGCRPPLSQGAVMPGLRGRAGPSPGVIFFAHRACCHD